MNGSTLDITEGLQAARKAMGLSQRELSNLAGVPQAQISRIETGAVDLRLSSLIALAHALDLELALVPRKAVPAVRSLSRNAIGSQGKNAVAMQKEMQRIEEALRDLQIRFPQLKGLNRLQKTFSEVGRFRVWMLDAELLTRLRKSIEQISRADIETEALNESLGLMRALSDKAAYAPRPDPSITQSRPAYSLDGDDDA